MDTVSHLVTGFGLAALAQIDPVVADHNTLSQAVLIGTVIGSHAPDFDIIHRLKGKGSYFRNHRGISHSLPVLPFWAITISSLIFAFLPGVSYLHLFLWTLLAVFLHVFFDLFNVHGTQALLPHSRKWLSFDTIPLVDPYILMLHFLGFSLLPFFMPSRIFLVIYIIICFYLAIRYVSGKLAKRLLQHHFINALRIKLIPRTALFQWNVIIETDEDFLFGHYSEKSLFIEHSLSKEIECPELVLESKKDASVSDFLASTHFAYPFVRRRRSGYFIFWRDLRFRTNKFFPNLAIQFISSDLKKKNTYIGKLNSVKEYRTILRRLEE